MPAVPTFADTIRSRKPGQNKLPKKGTMRFPFFISFVLVRRLRSVYLVLFFPTLLYSQSATAPTVLQDPITIDMVWQKASGKYDSARAALLQEAERVDQEGSFRPD